jgi:hypothetical protein
MMKQEGDVPSIKSLLKLKKRYEAPTEEELPQNYKWASTVDCICTFLCRQQHPPFANTDLNASSKS